VQGAPEKAAVLDEEGIVDAELLARDLELVLGRVLIRDEEAGRVVGILNRITNVTKVIATTSTPAQMMRRMT